MWYNNRSITAGGLQSERVSDYERYLYFRYKNTPGTDLLLPCENFCCLGRLKQEGLPGSAAGGLHGRDLRKEVGYCR